MRLRVCVRATGAHVCVCVSPDFTQRRTLTTHSQTRTLAVFAAAAQIRSGRILSVFYARLSLGRRASLRGSSAGCGFLSLRLSAPRSGTSPRSVPPPSLSASRLLGDGPARGLSPPRSSCHPPGRLSATGKRGSGARTDRGKEAASAVTDTRSCFRHICSVFSASGFGSAGGIPRARTASHADYPGCVIS